MNVIDINRRCAECGLESQDCVKVNVGSCDVCLDSSDIPSDSKDIITAVVGERNRYRLLYRWALCLITALAVCNIIQIIL